jgi:hypothetical protein
LANCQDQHPTIRIAVQLPEEIEMMKKMLMVALMSAVSVTAFASDAAREAAKQVIELKDGSTVYIFKDGKMGMEDKVGRATRMKKDSVMETKGWSEDHHARRRSHAPRQPVAGRSSGRRLISHVT